jgi:K+-transporting ATPase A subunit
MAGNMGTVDRVARVIIALAVFALYFAGKLTGLLGIILCVFALVFVVTSLFGFCPAYLPFRISTRKKA